MPRNAKLLTGFLMVLAFTGLRAQKVPSIRETLRSLRNDPVVASISWPDTGTIKCATSYMLALRLRWNQLAPGSRFALSQIVQRPALQTSRLSPSGKFRIHYDTAGGNQPALISNNADIPGTFEAYIDSAAAILDHVWTYEIDTLGYDPPPSDGTDGGGPEYDVYVVALNSGDFGYTDGPISNAVPNGTCQRFPSYIVIDNDYLGLRTPGMAGLEVTCAHEFHHAIQLGAYGYWTDRDFYFNELTSSWMEDVVYTDVNDYYYDVAAYFRGFRDAQGFPLSFTFYGPGYLGYERSLFAHYLSRRYGRDIMRQIWTGIRLAPFLRSAQAVFSQHASDWNLEFATFSYWNYFTADRADTRSFYPEGDHYPRFLPNFSVDFSGATATISSGGYPLSTAMYEFHVPGDSVTVISANTDLDAAVAGDNNPRSFEATLSRGILTIPHVSLADGYNVGTSAADMNAWRSFYLLSSTKTDIEKVRLQASPNPFRLAQASELMLPLSGIASTSASVYFLTSSLMIAYSGDFPIRNQFGNQFVSIPSSAIRSQLNSGVYFIVAKVAGNEYRWKVAIVR